MKIYFIIFLFFCSWVQAQDRLVITHKAFGGPPTIPPRGTDITQFIFKKKRNQFVAKSYTYLNKTIKLKEKQVISVSKVDSFINPKTPIFFKDLGFSIKEVKDAAQTENIYFFPQTLDLLKPNFILNFDSAYFCRDKRFHHVEYMTTCGGTTSEITYDNTLFFYYPNSFSDKTFDINTFLKLYIVLQSFEAIEDTSLKDHYGKRKALSWFVRFLGMLQCEDYYASLFMKENPEYNNSVFKRTKKGWNFEEYLKKINSSKN